MRITIVDDHPLVRQGLCSILSLEDDIQVLGEASNVKEAIQLIYITNPELAIIDLKLKNESGLEIVEKLKSDDVVCRVLILTSSANRNDFRQAEKLGVYGYVLKEALPEELLYAVRLVGKGRKYYDPGILDIVMNEDKNDPIGGLTPRELDVLFELGRGLKNNDIANKLYVTEYTVKKHVSQILDKLCLTDRTQAALFARERGLTK